MRLKQTLVIKKDQNAEKAIRAHAGFVNFVSTEVNKHGLLTVLSQERGDELHWLKKAYERLLEFAELYQLKQVPTKVEGTGEDGEIVIRVEKAVHDGDYVQAPRFAIPNIQ